MTSVEPVLRYSAETLENLAENDDDVIKIFCQFVNISTHNIFLPSFIITHLAGQTYVWHGCKWNFAGPQICLEPAKIKSQHFGVSLKFLVCN